MFFKNIKLWSMKKVRVIYIISLAVYFGLTIGGPIIVIGNQYDIFQGTASTVSGWGMIVGIIFTIVFLKKLKVKIYEMKAVTMGEQRFKYTVKLIYEIMVPAVVCFVLLCFKDNFDLAYNTVLYCLYPYIAGVLVDNLVCMYLKTNLDIRKEAAHANEVDSYK